MFSKQQISPPNLLSTQIPAKQYTPAELQKLKEVADGYDQLQDEAKEFFESKKKTSVSLVDLINHVTNKELFYDITEYRQCYSPRHQTEKEILNYWKYGDLMMECDLLDYIRECIKHFASQHANNVVEQQSFYKDKNFSLQDILVLKIHIGYDLLRQSIAYQVVPRIHDNQKLEPDSEWVFNFLATKLLESI